jgi:hypothetical protein
MLGFADRGVKTTPAEDPQDWREVGTGKEWPIRVRARCHGHATSKNREMKTNVRGCGRKTQFTSYAQNYRQFVNPTVRPCAVVLGLERGAIDIVQAIFDLMALGCSEI